MKKFWLIEVCYILILITYPFEAIGSDRDPETGEMIKNTENSKEKYSQEPLEKVNLSEIINNFLIKITIDIVKEGI